MVSPSCVCRQWERWPPRWPPNSVRPLRSRGTHQHTLSRSQLRLCSVAPTQTCSVDDGSSGGKRVGGCKLPLTTLNAPNPKLIAASQIGLMAIASAKATNTIIIGMAFIGFGGGNCQLAAFSLVSACNLRCSSESCPHLDAARIIAH